MASPLPPFNVWDALDLEPLDENGVRLADNQLLGKLLSQRRQAARHRHPDNVNRYPQTAGLFPVYAQVDTAFHYLTADNGTRLNEANVAIAVSIQGYVRRYNFCPEFPVGDPRVFPLFGSLPRTRQQGGSGSREVPAYRPMWVSPEAVGCDTNPVIIDDDDAHAFERTHALRHTRNIKARQSRLLRDGARPEHRNAQGERRAVPVAIAVRLDGAAMHLHQVMDEREPDTEPTMRA